MKTEKTDSSLRTRRSLLARLANAGDSVGWTEFYGLYRKLVYGLCRRSNLSNEEAEEVTQDVFARVASTIGTFESDPARGSFRGWLMNLTRWRIKDKFRERPKGIAQRSPQSADDPDRTSTIDRIPDASQEPDWDGEWQATVLAAALERVARGSKPKHFQVLDLYRRQNWSVLRISRELKMNAASVYTIKRRLTLQLKEEVELLRKQIE
jgi:RNA polymerase sigma-70 factor (ECF subfamily)